MQKHESHKPVPKFETPVLPEFKEANEDDEADILEDEQIMQQES